MQLPVSPLDRSRIVLDVEEETFSIRFAVRRVFEERCLVNAINGPTVGQCRACHAKNGAEDIGDADDFI